MSSFVYDGDILFYTFVLACFKKKIFSYIRSVVCSAKVDDCAQLDQGEFSFDFPDYTFEPSCLVDNYDVVNTIINFKNELKFVDSQIFEMHFTGFTYLEIGRFLDMSCKQIDNKIQLIRKKFKKYLLNLNNCDIIPIE